MNSTGILLGLLVVLTGCGTKSDDAGSKSVVIYVSEDQVFSEPILKDFEKETGIQVKAVFDSGSAGTAMAGALAGSSATGPSASESDDGGCNYGPRRSPAPLSSIAMLGGFVALTLVRRRYLAN